jgi:hypothetical protein
MNRTCRLLRGAAEFTFLIKLEYNYNYNTLTLIRGFNRKTSIKQSSQILKR